MREIKEVLRQKGLGRSHRQIAESLKISAGAVGETMRRARAAGLTEFTAVEALPPSELEARLYPSTATVKRPLPDFAWVHRERRRPGVTLELLHLEYSEGNTDGYGYTQFCEYYRQWLGRRGLSMRQVHVAGEKTFVDYSGKKPCIWDPKTGEAIEVELFVAVLGASNLHLRRGHAHAAWSRLDRQPHPNGRVLWRRHGRLCMRPAPLGRDDPVPVRAGGPAHLRGVGRAPRRGRAAGARSPSQRQGQGRDGRARRPALDPRADAQRAALLPRLAERADRRASRGTERSADAGVPGKPSRDVRAARSPGAQAAARHAIHVRRVEDGQGQRRLPRRGRWPLLLGPVSAPGRAGGSARLRRHGGGDPRRRSALPRMPAASSVAATPRCPSTCPSRIASTWSGARRA